MSSTPGPSRLYNLICFCFRTLWLADLVWNVPRLSTVYARFISGQAPSERLIPRTRLFVQGDVPRRDVGAAAYARAAGGLQPSRFLTDRAEAERAFQLAEQLGSVNAAATQLGTTWPSLRKAFTRHGLGMPARNPEAVHQRAIAVARQRTGQPTGYVMVRLSNLDPPAASELVEFFTLRMPDQ